MPGADAGQYRRPLTTHRSLARKSPWRNRWPDLIRDEVLSCLPKLDAERAEEELLCGAAAARKKKPNNPPAWKSTAAPPQGEILPGPQKDLFADRTAAFMPN